MRNWIGFSMVGILMGGREERGEFGGIERLKLGV